MKTYELEKIKAVYDKLQGGLSNPIEITEAFQYLPNYSEGVPMIAKIRLINRFMMLDYADYLKTAESPEEATPVIPEAITDSVGTPENKQSQSHQEAVDDDMAFSRTAKPVVNDEPEILEFLTAEETQDLKQKKSGTKLVTKKRQPRKPVNKNINNTK